MLAIAIIVGMVGSATADCEVWAYEDTSAAGQARAQIFATSDLKERDALVAEAAGIARRQADANALDYVDVFLTRPEDGTNREDHMSLTTTVWMRFNPGGTPIINTLMVADATDAGANVSMEYGMITGERSELSKEEIEAIEQSSPPGVSGRCQ
ncbi:hypothetical protein [Roseivivax jejudonensis]|uniref:hypothetical protein n=1 Tax=Roseivivax jejudonensis TaxID=1529041 RepID=UPI00117B326E|nr:hypothetical protein [Roseivivax jejudonensis]